MNTTGRAPGFLTKSELQEFHTGAAAHAYRTFGCHALPGTTGHRFAVWAPHAQRVALVGDFNGWDIDATPMYQLAHNSGLRQDRGRAARRGAV